MYIRIVGVDTFGSLLAPRCDLDEWEVSIDYKGSRVMAWKTMERVCITRSNIVLRFHLLLTFPSWSELHISQGAAHFLNSENRYDAMGPVVRRLQWRYIAGEHCLDDPGQGVHGVGFVMPLSWTVTPASQVLDQEAENGQRGVGEE